MAFKQLSIVLVIAVMEWPPSHKRQTISVRLYTLCFPLLLPAWPFEGRSLLSPGGR